MCPSFVDRAIRVLIRVLLCLRGAVCSNRKINDRKSAIELRRLINVSFSSSSSALGVSQKMETAETGKRAPEKAFFPHDAKLPWGLSNMTIVTHRKFREGKSVG